MRNIKSLLKQKPVFTKAVVGYLIHENEVLLGLRKKVTLGLGKNLITGIGGKVESGETDDKALIREMQEEIGVKIEKFKKIGRVKFLFPHKPAWQQDVSVYIINSWEGIPMETVPIKPMWFDKNNLPEKQMWPDNLYWIPKVLQGESVNATFLYDEKGEVLEFLFD